MMNPTRKKSKLILTKDEIPVKRKHKKNTLKKKKRGGRLIHHKIIQNHKGNYAFIDNENVNVSVQKM